MKISSRLLCLLALPGLLGAATSETRELIESGNSFYRMGLYEEAGKQYLRAAQIDQESPEINFNLGNVYHQKFLESKLPAAPGEGSSHASEWEQKAVTAYKQALVSDSPTLRAKALFNLGNTYAEADQRGEAIAAYEEALRILPNDEDTKHNLELLFNTAKSPPVIEMNGSNVVDATVLHPKHGPKTTNVVGKAQAMGGGGGKGQGEQQEGGLGAGTGAGTTALSGGGGAGKAALAGGGGVGRVALGQTTDPHLPAAAESAGGKISQNTAGAGGPAGAVEGRTGTASADKVSTKDKTASSSAQRDTTTSKDQDKSVSASTAATDTLDPKRQEVLDKASKAEQRYINQWTRPPDLKKTKDQDW